MGLPEFLIFQSRLSQGFSLGSTDFPMSSTWTHHAHVTRESCYIKLFLIWTDIQTLAFKIIIIILCRHQRWALCRRLSAQRSFALVSPDGFFRLAMANNTEVNSEVDQPGPKGASGRKEDIFVPDVHRQASSSIRWHLSQSRGCHRSQKRVCGVVQSNQSQSPVLSCVLTSGNQILSHQCSGSSHS
jgi:hypothetical protein